MLLLIGLNPQNPRFSLSLTIGIKSSDKIFTFVASIFQLNNRRLII